MNAKAFHVVLAFIGIVGFLTVPIIATIIYARRKKYKAWSFNDRLQYTTIGLASAAVTGIGLLIILLLW